MKLIRQIFESLEDQTADEIKAAINQRIFDVGFEGVSIDRVEPTIEGEVMVTFSDDDESNNDEMAVLFAYDPEDGAEAILLGNEVGNDESEVDMIDLDALEPKLIDLGNGDMQVDLVNNKWMNATFFETLFAVGTFMDNTSTEISERSALVVRNGKKVKIALVRRKRKKRLTAKQKAGIKKGARVRNTKKGLIARKRKKSLKLRKRLDLKQNKNKKLKVQGT